MDRLSILLLGPAYFKRPAEGFADRIIKLSSRPVKNRAQLGHIWRTVLGEDGFFRFDIQDFAYKLSVQTQLVNVNESAFQNQRKFIDIRSIHCLRFSGSKPGIFKFIPFPARHDAEVIGLTSEFFRRYAHREGLLLKDVSVSARGLPERNRDARRITRANARPGSGHDVRRAILIKGSDAPNRRGLSQNFGAKRFFHLSNRKAQILRTARTVPAIQETQTGTCVSINCTGNCRVALVNWAMAISANRRPVTRM